MKSERYDLDEALQEAEEKKDLVGNSGTTEDYDLAEELFEEKKWKEPAYLEKRLKEGKVSICPPDHFHRVMIAFQNESAEIRKCFNMAANRVTKEYGGFHQVGSLNTGEYTAWELLGKLRDDKKLPKIVRAVEEEMGELQKLGIFERFNL